MFYFYYYFCSVFCYLNVFWRKMNDERIKNFCFNFLFLLFYYFIILYRWNLFIESVNNHKRYNDLLLLNIRLVCVRKFVISCSRNGQEFHKASKTACKNTYQMTYIMCALCKDVKIWKLLVIMILGCIYNWIVICIRQPKTRMKYLYLY